MKDLAVIILNYNTKDLSLDCLKAIFSNKWKKDIEVWLVDNASSDDTVKAIKEEFPQVKIIENDKNLGFAYGNNLALRQAQTRYCLILNTDTKVLPGSLDKLVEFADNDNFDIVACKLLDGEGNFQANAGQLPALWPTLLWLSGLDDILKRVIRVCSYQARDVSYYQNGKEVGWVSGAAMLISQKVLQKVGYLDEKIFMYGEDVEFCLRAKRAGFRVGWTDQAAIIHLGGKSSKDPKYRQWLGEFKGLLYIYHVYYGFFAALILKLLMYVFIFLRGFAFLLLGKYQFSKTYGKIFINL